MEEISPKHSKYGAKRGSIHTLITGSQQPVDGALYDLEGILGERKIYQDGPQLLDKSQTLKVTNDEFTNDDRPTNASDVC